MADIFISYSKADHALAFKLSAFLEAEGWSVWWDRDLSAGEAYRDEIMRELAAARAVIVIWTQTSVGSDWARAEAGRAKAEGKLIPVKAPGLTYSDIPLPFGEMHTETSPPQP
jgi:adenylate cyclase